MHSFQGKTCVIHHNADLSGDITINNLVPEDDKEHATITIDIDDLIDFLAEAAKQRAQEQLEKQFGRKNSREILGL